MYLFYQKIMGSHTLNQVCESFKILLQQSKELPEVKKNNWLFSCMSMKD